MKAVFIGGCPRSGTTMLGAMLGAHPACVCVPEMPFKIELLRECSWAGGGPPRSEIAAALQRHWRYRFWNVDLEDLPETGHGAAPERYRLTLESLVRGYAAAVGKPQADVWVDHTPGNTRYAHTLFERFETAKMIHLVRDGRGVAASVLPLDWGPNSILHAAAWWPKNLAYGLAAEARWSEARVRRVRFEDLLVDSEAPLRSLCDFLELDFVPEMRNPTGFRVPRYTAAHHALIGGEPQRGRAEAWRQTLTAREIEIFEGLTGDLLGYLGYERLFGVAAAAPTRTEELRSHVGDGLHTAGNLVRRLGRMKRSLPKRSP
ncbi:MAG: sulfotransferase [Gemmatimonadota bacterium]